MPARNSCISSGETSSKSIRTGIRCCTLTKLPAELSVGTSEYFDPVASEMAVTVPWKVLSPSASTRIRTFCPMKNAGDLGLFVVCRDPFVLAADQVADRLSTLEQLPRLDGAPSHVAVVRGRYDRVRQVQLRHFQFRLFAQYAGFNPGPFVRRFGILRFGRVLLAKEGIEARFIAS